MHKILYVSFPHHWILQPLGSPQPNNWEIHTIVKKDYVK